MRVRKIYYKLLDNLIPVDKHYEYWMVASSYLAYGGVMQVIRADDDGLKNAVIGAGTTIGYGGLKIKSGTHYNQLGYDENVITGVEYVAKTLVVTQMELKLQQ